MLYRFENIEKSYGPHDVLRGVTWQHDPGEKIRASGLTIGHVSQHLDAEEGMTLFDYVETAFAEVLAIEQKMRAIEHDLADTARADHDRLLEKYAELQHDYEHADGYTLHAEVERVLTGVGFEESGGERPI